MQRRDRARLDAIHAMPCIACEMEAQWSVKRGETSMAQPLRTEAHHVVDKGYREHSGGDMATLPLCGWHHRGEPAYPLRPSEMLFLHGPSLMLHKRRFVTTYGTERNLLEEVDNRLRVAA